MTQRPASQEDLEELTQFTAGLHIILIALAETLIDAGSVDRETLISSIQGISGMLPSTPGAETAIRPFIGQIEASAGPLGHAKTRSFSELVERLRKLGGGIGPEEPSA